jgi:hypothetical protein
MGTLTWGTEYGERVAIGSGVERTFREPAQLERVTGIEPAWPAWKAGALPLSYTRASRTRPEAV